jgi:hypothetical protein
LIVGLFSGGPAERSGGVPEAVEGGGPDTRRAIIALLVKFLVTAQFPPKYCYIKQYNGFTTEILLSEQFLCPFFFAWCPLAKTV